MLPMHREPWSSRSAARNARTAGARGVRTLEVVVGRRDEKTAATRRRLAEEARRLAREVGCRTFTVRDVAFASGVSTRTFFNYFDTKEEALFRYEEDDIRFFVTRLGDRPDGEHPVVSVTTCLTPTGRERASFGVLWQERARLVEAEPSWLPHHLAARAVIERRLTGIMRLRLGARPHDPAPSMVVHGTVAALCAALSRPHGDGRPRSVIRAARDVEQILVGSWPRTPAAPTHAG